jgi:hypothetical protein
VTGKLVELKDAAIKLREDTLYVHESRWKELSATTSVVEAEVEVLPEGLPAWRAVSLGFDPTDLE